MHKTYEEFCKLIPKSEHDELYFFELYVGYLIGTGLNYKEAVEISLKQGVC